ncbi:MAG: hypothetical protein HKN47_16775 [Pirellulaceae bacterium]|nr:hypothetical protein [Pirellulaceae bacterium]
MIQLLKRFHAEERGDDTLKNVMMLALAAMIVVALIAFGKRGMEFLFEREEDILDDSAIPTSN